MTGTMNESVVLETDGRGAAEGSGWCGGGWDFRSEVTQVAVNFVRVLQ